MYIATLGKPSKIFDMLWEERKLNHERYLNKTRETEKRRGDFFLKQAKTSSKIKKLQTWKTLIQPYL